MQEHTELRIYSKDNKDIHPWWQQPYLWLVLSGPLLVVIASLITAAIAAKLADPVVAEDYYKQGININKTLAVKPQDRSLVPAQQARNHVMTPALNGEGKK
jgi:uncharacterized protein